MKTDKRKFKARSVAHILGVIFVGITLCTNIYAQTDATRQKRAYNGND